VLDIKVLRIVPVPWDRFILFSAICLSQLFFWHQASFQILPGDIGDSRVAALWMENWYSSIRNLNAPWNVPNFFPLKNTLSGSDAFFLQGIVHSIFRFFGAGIAFSFLLTTILLHFVGSLSSFFLAKKLNIHLSGQLVFVATYGTLNTFWMSRNHVQLLLFPMLGWLLYFVMDFKNHPSRSLNFGLILFFSLLLSAAYIVSFLLVFLILFIPIWVLIMKVNLRSLMVFFRNQKINWRLILVCNSPLVALFMRIYLSGDRLIGSHGINETLFYSPSLTDLIDQSRGGTSLEQKLPIISNLYEKISTLPNPTGEPGGTFTFLTLVLLFLSVILLIIWYRDSSAIKLLLLVFSVFIIFYLLILKDGRGQNVWVHTFSHMPFFDSIRALSRLSLFMSCFIPFILAFSYSKLYSSINKYFLKAVFLATSSFLTIALVLCQAVPYYGSFSSKSLSVSNLSDFHLDKKCNSFYLVHLPGAAIPAWQISVDALTLATLSSVPTINGSSSFVPESYASNLVSQENAENLLSDLRVWVNSNNLSRVCLVTYVFESSSIKLVGLNASFK
jgi:hypothetical protein